MSVPSSASQGEFVVSEQRRDRIKHLLIAPPLIFFAVFAIFPLLFTLWVSLNFWPIGGEHRFVALGNYQKIFTDISFLISLRNNILYPLIAVPLQYALGIGVALLIHQVTRGQRLVRLICFMPMMMTPIVVGFIWNMLFYPTYGPIDFVLWKIGLPKVDWITNPAAAFISIIITDTWQWTPLIILIMLGGLRSLPHEPFESAVVDGASSWRIFWDMTFPMLLPYSVAAIVLRAIEAFKLFDIVFLMTGGGPGVSTSTISLIAYFTSFRTADMGVGAAMSILLLVIVIAFAMGFLKIMQRVMARSRRT